MPKGSPKPLFTISVAARLVEVHPRTLMLYEKRGLVKPHRTPKNRRLFSPKEIQFLNFVRFLTQEKGININGVQVLLAGIEVAREKNIDLKKRLFPEYKPIRIFS